MYIIFSLSLHQRSLQWMVVGVSGCHGILAANLVAVEHNSACASVLTPSLKTAVVIAKEQDYKIGHVVCWDVLSVSTHSFVLLIHVCLLTTYELNIFLIPSFLDMLSNKYNLLSQPVGRLLQLMKDPSLLLIILKSTPAKQTARGLFVCDMDALSS